MQGKLQEALDIMLRLRWDMAGVPTADAPPSRGPLFAVELADFRDMPADPDDGGAEVDEMLSHALTAVSALNGAMSGTDTEGARNAAAEPAVAMLQQEIEQLKTAMCSAGNDLPPFNPKADPKAGLCWVKGCGRKVAGFTEQNQWKVCGTCLLECKTDKKPRELMMIHHDDRHHMTQPSRHDQGNSGMSAQHRIPMSPCPAWDLQDLHIHADDPAGCTPGPGSHQHLCASS